MKSVDLMGMSVAPFRQGELVDHIFEGLERGEGGWIVTANLDILRRHYREADARRTYDAADLRVADGMPLVWASAIQGEKLPERVAGSSLVGQIAEEAARRGRSLYLLGGAPGSAEAAANELQRQYADLPIAGHSSPMVSLPPTSEELGSLLEELTARSADIVLVGLGSPKQEYVCEHLRQHLPQAWLMGVGISFSFVAGEVRRAPVWIQRAGLEWVHRMSQEPRRLAKRYLVDDLPFAARLFMRAAWHRAQRLRRK